MTAHTIKNSRLFMVVFHLPKKDSSKLNYLIHKTPTNVKIDSKARFAAKIKQFVE